ncbi:MAG TPA: hypothetical protein VFS21_23535, partial [Roseiflexaceae bacterium]|nr:hypothetical protein [Roseiflexaceae bacterium]
NRAKNSEENLSIIALADTKLLCELAFGSGDPFQDIQGTGLSFLVWICCVECQLSGASDFVGS